MGYLPAFHPNTITVEANKTHNKFWWSSRSQLYSYLKNKNPCVRLKKNLAKLVNDHTMDTINMSQFTHEIYRCKTRVDLIEVRAKLLEEIQKSSHKKFHQQAWLFFYEIFYCKSATTTKL
jgi:hypothetical protein